MVHPNFACLTQNNIAHGSTLFNVLFFPNTMTMVVTTSCVQVSFVERERERRQTLSFDLLMTKHTVIHKCNFTDTHTHTHTHTCLCQSTAPTSIHIFHNLNTMRTSCRCQVPPSSNKPGSPCPPTVGVFCVCAWNR